MSAQCNADLGRPCDANNGNPCDSCVAEREYWRKEWERYGRYEMRGREMREQYEADVMDAYSSPPEYQKRERLLRDL